MNAARIISFYGYDWMSSILPWQPLEVKFRFQNFCFNFISQMNGNQLAWETVWGVLMAHWQHIPAWQLQFNVNYI